MSPQFQMNVYAIFKNGYLKLLLFFLLMKLIGLL